jgi:TonB family protein
MPRNGTPACCTRRTTARLRAVAFIAITTSSALAQSPATNPTCAQKLNAPTTDSMVLQLEIRVADLDTSHHLPLHRAAMIGEGIRQFVSMPRALAMDVYSPGGKESYQWIVGVYRVTLRRDGHLTRARTVGGTRTTGLDTSIVASLVALDTSGLIGPPDSLTMGSADSLDLRIVISPTNVWSTKTTKVTYTPREGSTPFLRLRVPVRGSSGPPYPNPNNPRPVYPADLRAANIEGEVYLTFVVGPDGVPEASTVQVGRLTALQFASAALEVLPKLRFDPLKVEGCPVAALAIMPFQFHLSPR